MSVPIATQVAPPVATPIAPGLRRAAARLDLRSVVAEALASLLNHPLRSLLTALSVTFGAAVLVMLVSYASGVPDVTEDLLLTMGGKEFIVEPRRSRGSGGSRDGRRVRIRYLDLPAIREACPSIARLTPAYRPGRGGPVFAADRSWPWANLTGVGHDYREVTELRIVAGRWFTPEEEHGHAEVALVSGPLSEGLFDARLPLGETVDSWGRRFTIIGVYESAATFAYSMFVPYTTAMEMGDEGGRYVSQLAFAPRRPDLAASAIDELRTALATLYGFDPDDPTALDVRENSAFVAQVQAVSLGLEGLVLLIAVLALVLGCLGAANVVGIAVAERRAELGLRKALGATAARIRAEVLAETLLLCLLGGLLGAGLATGVVTAVGELAFTDEASLRPSVDGALLAGALVVLVVSATLAGLPAANRAAGLDPVEALRNE